MKLLDIPYEAVIEKKRSLSIVAKFNDLDPVTQAMHILAQDDVYVKYTLAQGFLSMYKQVYLED